MADLISKHGGYKNLKSFQMAEIVYDLTFEFINRYVQYFKDKEQMEGAARGGKQNIGEGSQTSGTSKQSELRLVMVARASQEELKLDYEDFLRKMRLPKWAKDNPKSTEIRQLAYKTDKTYRTYMAYMSNPESAANCLLCLINQTTYLLDKQLAALEKDLMEKGDYKERFYEIKKKQIMGSGREEDRKFLESLGFRFDENGLLIAEDKKDK